MINPAGNHFHLNRRETLWTVGTAAAVAVGSVGGPPIWGAGSVIPDETEDDAPNLPIDAFFAYGHYEDIPRVLDLMDKQEVDFSSIIIGKAVEACRVGTPTDIANAVMFLVTTPFAPGSTVRVDGGGAIVRGHHA